MNLSVIQSFLQSRSLSMHDLKYNLHTSSASSFQPMLCYLTFTNINFIINFSIFDMSCSPAIIQFYKELLSLYHIIREITKTAIRIFNSWGHSVISDLTIVQNVTASISY